MKNLIKTGSRLSILREGWTARIRSVHCLGSHEFRGDVYDDKGLIYMNTIHWLSNGAYLAGGGFSDFDLDPLSILSDTEAERLNRVDDCHARALLDIEDAEIAASRDIMITNLTVDGMTYTLSSSSHSMSFMGNCWTNDDPTADIMPCPPTPSEWDDWEVEANS